MQNAFVKMMSRISEIENYILKGLVIDEHGQWIPIADKKAVEEDFLAHLSAGQVLHEGRWVSIAEAKSAKAPTEIATAYMDLNDQKPATENQPAIPQDDTAQRLSDPIEETKSGEPAPAKEPHAEEGGEFPPETKTIIFSPPPDAGPEAQATAPLVDPQSGYAPETGDFFIEETPEQLAQQSEDPIRPGESSMVERTTTSLLLPTVSSWEQSAQKRRKQILVFGSLSVLLAGISALVILFFQISC
ncbi:MAG: hypothetical protein JW768_14205 [Chitinispirillaceae bacterium]|nr:hypothetical protein [Chitinispirillaceae bacterium]